MIFKFGFTDWIVLVVDANVQTTIGLVFRESGISDCSYWAGAKPSDRIWPITATRYEPQKALLSTPYFS